MNFTTDTHFLFASILWGAIGSGYCLYGQRQRAVWPFAGGAGMIGVSYFVDSAWLMSLLCVALMAGVYFLSKHAA